MNKLLTSLQILLKYVLLVLLTLSLVITVAGSDHRTETGIEYHYTGIVLDNTSSQNIRFKIENSASESKNLTTYISGVDAYFVNNKQDIISDEIEGNSQKEYVVKIEPANMGDRTLTLTTENQQYGINTTSSIPVTVKNYNNVTEDLEIPGMGMLQLIMLLLVSAYLYSVRL